jgi:uncharacterized caspase-like protein
MAADDFAVVIGINRYPYISPLRAPARDAIEFARWLQAPEGGNVPREHIYLFLSPMMPSSEWVKHPRLPEVREVFKQLVRRGEEKEKEGRQLGRRLYLFFSGHGVEDLNTNDYIALLMEDADLGLWASEHVPGLVFAHSLLNSGFFQEVALFMDTCRDSIILRGTQTWLFNIEKRVLTNAPLKFFSLATKWGRKAREVPLCGKRRWRGRFTNYLLEGLKGGARAFDEHQRITGESLRRFIKTRYDRLHQHTPEGLRRYISWPEYPAADDHFIFAEGNNGGVSSPPPVQILLTLADGRPLPRLQVIAHKLGEPVWMFNPLGQAMSTVIPGLPPGIYCLLAPEDGRSKMFEVYADDVIDNDSSGCLPDVKVELYDPTTATLGDEDT